MSDIQRPGLHKLVKALTEASGYPTAQRAIGLGTTLAAHGLPDKVELKDGRVILRDKDATDAMNYGDLNILPMDADESTLKHEATGRVGHAAQTDVLGPAMIPARLIEMLYPYGKGPLEKAAFHSMGSDSPLPPEKDGDLYQRLMNWYFRKTTGDK